jgi:hypothetical protein
MLFVLATSAPLLAAGCASVTYLDSEGFRHVIGLVDVTIPNPLDANSKALATAVTITSLGLAISRPTDGGSNLLIGYGRETIVSLPQDACLDLEYEGPCATVVDAVGKVGTP